MTPDDYVTCPVRGCVVFAMPFERDELMRDHTERCKAFLDAYSDEEIGGLGSGPRYPIDPAKRYNAEEKAKNLAVVLGIHEQSAAFVHLVRELRIIERIDELTVDKVHLGPNSLARVRTVIEDGGLGR
jgi:hypothetical protein